MDRRAIMQVPLAVCAFGLPMPAAAQVRPADKPYRIALVPELARPGVHKEFIDTLRAGGRIEGRDYVFVRPGLQYGQPWNLWIRQVVDQKPDLVVAGNTAVARAFQASIPTTPVVLWGGGLPVEGGVVDSLARPGRRVTGVTAYADTAVFGKYLQLLHEAKPAIRRVAVVWSQVPPLFPRHEIDHALAQFRASTRQLRLELRILETAEPEDIDAAMDTLGHEGVDALVLTVGRTMAQRIRQLMAFAARKRLPTLCDIPWQGVDPAPLLVYVPHILLLLRQAAGYVERILWGGANPGELPMQQPTKFYLAVNLKTAQLIGVTVPRSLLLRADEVVR